MIKYLTLRARHFKEGTFLNGCFCPIANAANEKFNTNNANEGVDNLLIGPRDNRTIYLHLEYYDQFHNDYKLAEENNFDNTKIRTIRLTLRE